MLTLTVTACRGQPLAEPLSASFDVEGGTIGRAETSRLVLADPERLVSRVHARVERRGGRWQLAQQGANPVLVNGRPVAAGDEVALEHGDAVQIGAYDIMVRIDAAAQACSASSCESSHAQFADADSSFDVPGHTETDPLRFFMPEHAPRRVPRPAASPLAEPVSAPNTHQGDNPMESLLRATQDVPPRALPESGLGIESAFITPEFTTPRASVAEPARKEAPAAQVNVDADVNRDMSRDVSALSLRASFARGAGIDDADLAEFTPEFAERLGALLREALQGTVDLLIARQAVKQMLHARLTLIEPRDNNPLKHAANADAALRSVLGVPRRGYLGGSAALRDACNDLRAHQFGFLAGLRGAIGGMFERFSPQRIDALLPPPSNAQNLLPVLRDAQRWRSFAALYARLVGESEEDFFTLFGAAFRSAYEESVEQHKHQD
ncbi:type VI secretion system-associated FHA domain protein TagH [Caballeronia sp. 15715]|uniref:type VI secretion system-associated FHA domain protein TagH n=1 Tax=Caballeronia sp. 15715 TaxID=3391030 RepID=UPI0039E3081F